MTNQPVMVRLVWRDPKTIGVCDAQYALPLSLGRSEARNDITLPSSLVSSHHAKLTFEDGKLLLSDRGSRNGTWHSGKRIDAPQALAAADQFQIGPYEFGLELLHHSTATTSADSLLVQPPAKKRSHEVFPPAAFAHPVVNLADLTMPYEEITYLTIGGGIGSFVWVNHLLVYGAEASQIAAIGFEPKPYGRYRQLCLNSQIPNHERLRSNSDACPDNLWGWPGYAVREMWHSTWSGNLSNAARVGWQIFNEPIVETYTPRANMVFDAMDREAARIGWDDIFRHGRVRAIRKTADERYVVAWSHINADGSTTHRLLVTRYLHLAVGYPGVQFLPDLKQYRELTGDREHVVNAYEPHDHVYEQLGQRGGTILLRGRGIVASRILQRIHEVRAASGQNIRVVHLMRTPRTEGASYRASQREVHHHWEYQPFNWPKAIWGGELRTMLEEADREERLRLLKTWGGTTTADRTDWREIVETGLRQGWYTIQFGRVLDVSPHHDGTIATCIQSPDDNLKANLLLSHFIVDATGLNSGIERHALLKDLVYCYNLPRNVLGRLDVTPDFELAEMQNGAGRMYAAGVSTLGGPYAAVDSFLGLQYAALRSADHMAADTAPGLRRLKGVRSFRQWTRWARGVKP